jgi:hypothetical protein
MGWLAASIAFVGTTYFAIHYAGFRKLLLWTGVTAVCLASATALYIFADQQKRDAEYAKQIEQKSKLIAATDLELSDVKISVPTYGRDASVTGTVINKSQYILENFEIQFTILDCPFSYLTDRKCNIIGQSRGTAYSDVPSGQKRAFYASAAFADLPPLEKDQWSWTYVVTGVVGH